jgi:hypothetical protein
MPCAMTTAVRTRPIDFDRAPKHCAVECRRGLDTHDAVVLPPAHSAARVVDRANGSRRNRLPHPVTSPEKAGQVVRYSCVSMTARNTFPRKQRFTR